MTAWLSAIPNPASVLVNPVRDRPGKHESLSVSILTFKIHLPNPAEAQVLFRCDRITVLLQNSNPYAMARLGDAYDLRNVVDLARYLIPTPQRGSSSRRTF